MNKNVPTDNKMLVKTPSQENLDRLAALSIAVDDAPHTPILKIVFFPTGWTVDHKAHTASHPDGTVFQF